MVSRGSAIDADENLPRAELSPADRPAQTTRRKAIYLELHPDTAQHLSGGVPWQSIASDNLSFAASTAEAIGKTERTVQRDAERGEKVCEEALNLVRGTALDTGSYLDRLKYSVFTAEKLGAESAGLPIHNGDGRNNGV